MKHKQPLNPFFELLYDDQSHALSEFFLIQRLHKGKVDCMLYVFNIKIKTMAASKRLQIVLEEQIVQHLKTIIMRT